MCRLHRSRGAVPAGRAAAALLAALLVAAPLSAEPDLPKLAPGTGLFLDHEPTDPRDWFVVRLTGPAGTLRLLTLERIGGEGDAGLAVGTGLGTGLGSGTAARAGLTGILASEKGPDDGLVILCVAAPPRGGLLVEVWSEDDRPGAWYLGHDIARPDDPRCGALPLS